MKKIFIFLFLFLSSLSINSQTKGMFVSTKSDAVLYKLNNDDSRETYNEAKRNIICIEQHKSKKLHKPRTLQIIGLTNSNIQFPFDTYIVMFRNNKYYLPKQFVENNSYIDSVNTLLASKYSQIRQRAYSLKYEYDSIIAAYTKISEDKLSYFTSMTNKLPSMIDSIKQASITNYEKEMDLLYKKQYDEWYKKLPLSTKNALKHIEITKAELDDPNSAGGCDYQFIYKNKSKKTIKYLDWNGWVYNAVNDIVSCDIRNTGHVSGRDTGPIGFEQEGGGIWDCVIYNYSARNIKLSSIAIQYLDNSIILIKGKDIKRMLSKPIKKDTWFERDSIRKSISTLYGKKLTEYKDSATIWEDRLSIFNRASTQRPIESDKIKDTPSFLALYKKIEELQYNLQQVKSDIINFEKENFINDQYNENIKSNINKSIEQFEYEKTLNSKIAVGTGIDWLISGDYIGTSIPLEIIFGSMNQLVNFSVSGNYTYLNNYGNISFNQLCAIATLHFNLGKSNVIKFPFSIGLGYNANLGNNTYEVTGYYFLEDYTMNEFSFPIYKRKSNISSMISIGIRKRHWKFNIYGRFDLTPMFDKSNVIEMPQNDLFYDNYSIETIFKSPDTMPLFGMSLRYYF